jgi:hypothetical protein
MSSRSSKFGIEAVICRVLVLTQWKERGNGGVSGNSSRHFQNLCARRVQVRVSCRTLRCHRRDSREAPYCCIWEQNLGVVGLLADYKFFGN